MKRFSIIPFLILLLWLAIASADELLLLGAGPYARTAAGYSNPYSGHFVRSATNSLSMTTNQFGAWNKQTFQVSLFFRQDSLPAASGYRFLMANGASDTTCSFLFYICDGAALGLSAGTYYMVFEPVDATPTQYYVIKQWTSDTNSFHHVTARYDSTQATASNRIILEYDGSAVTPDFSNYPALNTSVQTSTNAVCIGNGSPSSSALADDGYIDEVAFVSGATYSSSTFRDASGKPKDLTGTSGLVHWVPFNSTVVDDSVDSDDWTNNNGVTQSSTVP